MDNPNPDPNFLFYAFFSTCPICRFIERDIIVDCENFNGKYCVSDLILPFPSFATMRPLHRGIPEGAGSGRASELHGYANAIYTPSPALTRKANSSPVHDVRKILSSQQQVWTLIQLDSLGIFPGWY